MKLTLAWNRHSPFSERSIPSRFFTEWSILDAHSRTESKHILIEENFQCEKLKMLHWLAPIIGLYERFPKYFFSSMLSNWGYAFTSMPLRICSNLTSMLLRACFHEHPCTNMFFMTVSNYNHVVCCLSKAFGIIPSHAFSLNQSAHLSTLKPPFPQIITVSKTWNSHSTTSIKAT